MAPVQGTTGDLAPVRSLFVRVVIVGAGIGGLGSALALARAGHEVTVLERDATPMPADAAEAFAWDRRGAPQVRHSHAFLARLRNLLATRTPDVLADLLAAGATELRFCDQLPETLTDREPRPGDDELVAIACRRTTFEWVLRRRALHAPGVTFRDGVTVTGLIIDLVDPGGALPVVRGVATADGEVLADLVVDASGPRSVSETWLSAAGVHEPEPRVHDCGIVYLSRFYELRDGAEPPVSAGPIAGDLGYLKYAVFVGDNRTFSITLAVDANDAPLRRALLADAGFEAAATTILAARPWRDGRSEPITEVHVMAGLRNRKRTLVVDDRPVALGFLTVGDAAICTNPLYGRGCSLALVHAFALADAVAAHGDDPLALALELHAATERELDPWFRAAVLQDKESSALAAGASGASDADAGPTTGADGVVNPRAWARAVFRDGLLPAVRTSPIVFRAFLRWFNLLATPDALINDPEVLAEALRSYENRAERPPDEQIGPATRRELLEALLAAPAGPHEGDDTQ